MADSEFKLFRCIAEEELVIPLRRIRPHKPELAPDHVLTPEELEEYETEPVDDDLRDLIKRLLTKNPSKRILLKEVKRHPWVLQGIKDPIGWVDKTDPERTSQGNKIEVTTEDVETAVSVPGIVNRAKTAIRKAAGSWVKTLRKRGSSTVSMRDSKGKQLADVSSSGGASVGGSKQGQQKTFLGFTDKDDDPEKELQWMGGVEEPREDETLNPLAPSGTNSSSGSSETTVQAAQNGGENEFHDQQWSSGVTGSQWTQARSPPLADKRLRRKQSMGLLGYNLLRRHSSHSHDTSHAVRTNHRAPIEAPPVSPMDDTLANIFKAGSTAALVSPSISRRVVRGTRSDDFARAGRNKSMYDDSGLLTAREVLSDALHQPRDNGSDYVTLPTGHPQLRSLYKPLDVENGLLNIYPKVLDSNMKQKVERHRREEQEQARRRLGKVDLDDDQLDLPCPPSPDDDASPQRLHGQENQRMMLEENERQRCASAYRTPEGWSRESFYHPARDYPTPPIAMGSRSRGYFDPPSPSHAALVSSSSDERFVTTAGSSLTNSTSFPSIATDPSSVSSDMFLGHCSRRGSFVPPENSFDYGGDDDDRFRLMQAQTRGRKMSELLFQHEEDDEDSGSDSEGGFVMKDTRRPRRSQSIIVGDLARKSDEVKDAAIKRGTATRPRYLGHGSGSTSTVKHFTDA